MPQVMAKAADWTPFCVTVHELRCWVRLASRSAAGASVGRWGQPLTMPTDGYLESPGGPAYSGVIRSAFRQHSIADSDGIRSRFRSIRSAVPTDSISDSADPIGRVAGAVARPDRYDPDINQTFHDLPALRFEVATRERTAGDDGAATRQALSPKPRADREQAQS